MAIRTVNRALSEIKRVYTILQHSVDECDYWWDYWVKKTEAKRQHTTYEIEAGFRELVQEVQKSYNTKISDIEDRFKEEVKQLQDTYTSSTSIAIETTSSVLKSLGTWVTCDWDNRDWVDYSPSVQQPIPEVLRLGKFVIEGYGERLRFPALLPFIGGRNVVFEASGAGKERTAIAVQSLMLRLLATLPPGKLRFMLIDPVGLGQNAAAFMHLADYDEALVTSKAWTEPQHIEAQLGGLSEHMEMVIQKFLRDKYPSLEAYNVEAGEVAEPYRVLVVFNFPVNFNDTAARRLVSIASNGARCGVYALVTVDTQQPLPHGFNLPDLERTATVIDWGNSRFIWQEKYFKDCDLELDSPSTELRDRVIHAVGAAAKEGTRVEVPFLKVAPPPETWWKGESRYGIQAALGRAGATKIQCLDLGKGTAQHALIAGKTGSGKSTLLHALITNLALTYSPDELELYLIDFKKGVEFKTYATHELPHARVIAIESEREFGISVLQGLDVEQKRRGDLFRASGVDHVADYRQKNGEKMPRIMLIVDEFQEFFTEDDAVASQAAQILDRLVRQGRAFGIHVLLGSQTLAGAYTLARSTIDQMAVRIALQCSEADSRLILADDNPGARLLSRPGEAIYNAANGLVEGNNLFQVAWLPVEQRDEYLEGIKGMAKVRSYSPLPPQIVFEGNAPAEAQKNRPLNDLLAAGTWSTPSRITTVWLGEPIAIKEATTVFFRNQSGNNLLIVGQNEEMALGMMVVALISLTAQHHPRGSRFYVLDFTPVDSPYVGLFSQMAGRLPHSVRVAGRRDLAEVIAEIASEVDRRINQSFDSSDIRMKGAGDDNLYFFVCGLQRGRDLRQEEAGFSMPSDEEAAPNPAGQFVTILREGPDIGVHTLVWCDTYNNLTRTLERRSLREFELRVLFQMSAEDSSNLIDNPSATKLGPYRALYFSEEQGQAEKFRPYGLPPRDWLTLVGEKLKTREQSDTQIEREKARN